MKLQLKIITGRHYCIWSWIAGIKVVELLIAKLGAARVVRDGHCCTLSLIAVVSSS